MSTFDQTDYEKILRELQQQEQLYRTLAENFPDIIARFSRDFRHLYVTPSIQKFTGMPPEHFIGKTNEELGMPPELVQEWNAALQEVFEKGTNRLLEFSFSTPDGLRYFQSTLAPERKKDGTIDSVICVNRDITEKKAAERELASNRDQLENLVQQRTQKLQESERNSRNLALVARETNNLVIISNAEGRIEWFNPAFARLTGYTLEEAMGKKPGDLLQGPETSPHTIASVREALAAKRGIRVELVNYAKGGRKYWIDMNIQPILDSQGNVERFIAVEIDITDRKRAEQLQSEKARQITLLKDIASIANAAATTKEALEASARFIGEYLDWDLGHAFIFSTDLQKLIDAGVWFEKTPGKFEAFKTISSTLSFETGQGFIGHIFKDRRARWLENVGYNPDFLRMEAARAAGIKTGIAFPIIVQKQVAAILEFYDLRFHFRDEALLEVLEQVSNQLQLLIERKQVESELVKLYKAVENSPITVVITNRQGLIEYANPKFTQVTGYSLSEVLGQTPRVLNSRTQSPSFFEELWDTILAGKEWHGEFCNRTKSGTLYWEQASISPIRDSHGNITHFVAVKEDITGLRSLIRELEKAKESADAANRAKSEFLANMSHEIRTPLNAVLGLVYLALQNESSPQVREYLKKADSAGKHLLAIVSDILDFSKIEAGKIDLEIIPFHIEALVQDTITLFSFKAQEKAIALCHRISPDLPRSLLGDPLRISQILNNLLGNALKFTASGEICVELELLEEKGLEILVRLAVKDTGIGMSVEEQKRLFQPFTQADNSTTRRFGGTGLGLSISHRLVKLMHGEISVTSEPGKGSTFSVQLPLRKSDHHVPRSTESPLQPTAPSAPPMDYQHLQRPLEELKSLLEKNDFKALSFFAKIREGSQSTFFFTPDGEALAKCIAALDFERAKKALQRLMSAL